MTSYGGSFSSRFMSLANIVKAFSEIILTKTLNATPPLQFFRAPKTPCLNGVEFPVF